MRSLLAAVVLFLVSVLDAEAASKVLYLNHASAVGMPELLGELIASESPWVEELQPHWAGLKLEVKADVNAIEAEGPTQALAALKSVLGALDIPRRTVTLSYRHVRVEDPALLLGKPAGPPTAGALAREDGEQPIALRLAPGEWVDRVRKLAEAGHATILREGEVNVLDGHWGALYFGDPEAEPEFLFQGKPVVTEDGEVWVTLAFGRIEREGAGTSEWKEAAEAANRPGLCMSCGPGVGDLRFVPEVTVSCVWPEWQSLLVEGPMWWKQDGHRPTGRERDFMIVTAQWSD
jgi:hypothetical protein